MDKAADFWKRINACIKAKKTKQESIATECNINYQTFRSWVTRGVFPDGQQTYLIAQALGVSVEWLITGTYNTTETTPYIDNIKDLLNQIISKMNELQKIIVQQSADQ